MHLPVWNFFCVKIKSIVLSVFPRSKGKGGSWRRRLVRKQTTGCQQVRRNDENYISWSEALSDIHQPFRSGVCHNLDLRRECSRRSHHVHFRAQQRAKYSSLQLTAVCIAAGKCPRHHLKCTWESPTIEHTISDTSAPLIQISNRMASNVVRNRKFSDPVIFGATSRYFLAYRTALMTKTDLIFCCILYQICRLRSSILLTKRLSLPGQATLDSSLMVAWFSEPITILC